MIFCLDQSKFSNYFCNLYNSTNIAPCSSNRKYFIVSITATQYDGISDVSWCCLSSETPVTSITKVTMELNHCTTGRALAVTANTTIVVPGCGSLPRVSASTQISPQALLLPKYGLGMDPKQRHCFSGSSFLSPACLPGSSTCRNLQRVGWVWA